MCNAWGWHQLKSPLLKQGTCRPGAADAADPVWRLEDPDAGGCLCDCQGPHLRPVWVGDVASVADGALGHTTSPAAQTGLHISAMPVVVCQHSDAMQPLLCCDTLRIWHVLTQVLCCSMKKGARDGCHVYCRLTVQQQLQGNALPRSQGAAGSAPGLLCHSVNPKQDVVHLQPHRTAELRLHRIQQIKGHQ